MTHPQNPPRLWRIKGGIHPPFHKDLSAHKASEQAPLPDTLILPFKQMSGDLAGFQQLVNIGDYVDKGQALARCSVSTLHAPSSGYIRAIEDRPIPHPSGLQDRCFILDLDGKDQWGKLPYTPYPDYSQLTLPQLLERLQETGITGLGGAVFPTRIKLGALGQQQIHTLLVNGAECEPYISCDDKLMQEQPQAIIEGIMVILTVGDIEQCLIGIEDNKPEAISQLQQALADHPNKALQQRIHLRIIPSIYPSGDEKQLTHILTGVKIAPNTRLPDYGLLMQNVATVHSIYQAVVQGKPLIERYVTVTGQGIQQPQNFRALLGTPFAHLITAAGGYTERAERLLMGGPMMGYQLSSDAIPLVKATNCILSVPTDELAYSPDLAMPCIRCGKCTEVCPVDLLPQQLYWHARAENHEQAQKHQLFSCIECGCCSYVCPSKIPLVQYYRRAKAIIRDEQSNKEKAAAAKERHEFRAFRLERNKAEKAKKLAEHKKKVQQKTSSSDAKKAAIKAAMERAKAKKAAKQTHPQITPTVNQSTSE
ncbi:MAG: electron transport complex subunit RsxC [bacterium]